MDRSLSGLTVDERFPSRPDYFAGVVIVIEIGVRFVAISHSFTVLSKLAEASCVPSGLNTTLITPSTGDNPGQIWRAFF